MQSSRRKKIFDPRVLKKISTVFFLLFFFKPLSCFPEKVFSEKHFKNWDGFFRHISHYYEVELGLDAKQYSLVDMAAESTYHNIPTYHPISPDLLVLVKPNLFERHDSGWVNKIRGASDNGKFYFIRHGKAGIDLIGVMEGNVCSPSSVLSDLGPQVIFRCSSHISSTENAVQIYDFYWDGVMVKERARKPIEYLNTKTGGSNRE